MNAVVALTMMVLSVVWTTMLMGPAAAQSDREQILLTAGIVKRVDVVEKLIVLQNGRQLRPRAILLNDEWVDLSAVQPEDSITLSGIDLGHEEARASILPQSR